MFCYAFCITKSYFAIILAAKKMRDEIPSIDGRKDERVKSKASSRPIRSLTRMILERGVNGGRIKMSIRCVFRSLVSVVQPAPLRFTSSRARPPTRPKIAPFRSGRLLARVRLYRSVFSAASRRHQEPETRRRKITIIRELLAQYAGEHYGEIL